MIQMKPRQTVNCPWTNRFRIIHSLTGFRIWTKPVLRNNPNKKNRPPQKAGRLQQLPQPAENSLTGSMDWIRMSRNLYNPTKKIKSRKPPQSAMQSQHNLHPADHSPIGFRISVAQLHQHQNQKHLVNLFVKKAPFQIFR